MKKFTFRLESLMKYRRYLELQAQQEVARAYRDLKTCEQRIHHFEKELLRVATVLDRETAKGVSAIVFKSYSDYLDNVKDDLTRELSQKTIHERTLQEKQAILTQRSVDKQVIERLKTKKKSEYLEAFLRGEQNASDEIASLKKAREITNGTHN